MSDGPRVLAGYVSCSLLRIKQRANINYVRTPGRQLCSALCYDWPSMLMLCPICGAEFDMGSTVCPACAFELVSATLNEKAVTMIEAVERGEVEFVELCRPLIYPVAMLVKQTLEQNGVAAVMHGEHSLSVQPHLVFGGQLRVLVPSNQLDYARELYKAYFESDEGIDYIAEE